MKRRFSIVFTALVTFFIVMDCDIKIVDAKDDNNAKDNNYFFSFDVDGYWKPTDEKEHDFVIKNEYGKSCYIKSLSFNNIIINDIETNEEYTLKEAEDIGIIDAYNVILSLNDNKYGSMVLYNDKLKYFNDYNIELPQSLYMEENDEIKFNMAISMESKADNKYQNKHYVFSIRPDFYEVVYKEETSSFSNNLNKVNQYFKTGQDIISIIGYEIMFITCCFFIIYRIRQKQNVL